MFQSVFDRLCALKFCALKVADPHINVVNANVGVKACLHRNCVEHSSNFTGSCEFCAGPPVCTGDYGGDNTQVSDIHQLDEHMGTASEGAIRLRFRMKNGI